MPDPIIADLIHVFASSLTGRGLATLPDEIAHTNYQKLANDTTARLWALHLTGEFAFDPTAPDWHNTLPAPGHPAVDIRIPADLQPQHDTPYDHPENQAKLAAAALLAVRQAARLVRPVPDAEQEILARCLETSFLNDLEAGVTYDSEVLPKPLQAHLALGTSLPVQELRAASASALRDLHDDHILDRVLALKDYRDTVTPDFVRRALPWWGGPRHRTPQTLGYFLNILAADTRGLPIANRDAVLQILEAVRTPTEWHQVERTLAPAAAAHLGAMLSPATPELTHRLTKIQQHTGFAPQVTHA